MWSYMIWEEVNSKVLWQVMGFRLDHDMAQLRKERPLEPKKVDSEDLYKIANCQLWYGTGGPEMIEIVRCSMLYSKLQETSFTSWEAAGPNSNSERITCASIARTSW